MLEGDNLTYTLDELLASLTCEIELPAGWRKDFFRKRGPLPARQIEWRRFPRFHFRARAVLEYLPSFPALRRPPRRYCVYTKDISRDGLAFLHSEPLFPRERVRLWLPDEREAVLEVVDCERIDHRCFGVGGRFVSEKD